MAFSFPAIFGCYLPTLCGSLRPTRIIATLEGRISSLKAKIPEEKKERDEEIKRKMEPERKKRDELAEQISSATKRITAIEEEFTKDPG